MATVYETSIPSLDERPDELTLLARDFVLKEFPRHAARAKADPHRYPREFMQLCAEIGLLGLEIPEEYGGNIVPSLQQATVMEELARGDAALGLDILVQNSSLRIRSPASAPKSRKRVTFLAW